MKLLIGVAALVSCACLTSLVKAAHGPAAILTVTNPLGIARPEEVIELPLADVLMRLHTTEADRIQVKDSSNRSIVPTQLESDNVDGPPVRLLILVNVQAKQTVSLEFGIAPDAPRFEPLVFGRVVPERKDDFAWENDKVAYRVYGPALQATGEIGSGIDVWSKRVPESIINDWYARDAEGARTNNPALSYHLDNGQGLDSYEVGKGRGCGGIAVWNDGKLFPSKNYAKAEILDSGPLRVRFRLHYAPWLAGAVTVSEEKTITLDTGSHLNRIDSTLSFEGANPLVVAAGLGLHPGARVSSKTGNDVLSVWEPLSSPDAGMDGTAIVLLPGIVATREQAEGNALLLITSKSHIPITYYSGAGWSKADIPGEEAWTGYLADFSNERRRPLELHWR